MTELIEYTVVSQQDNSNVASRPSLNHVSLEVKMRSLGLGHGRCDVIASVQTFTSCLFLLLEIRDCIPQNNENFLILKSLNVSCWFSSSFYLWNFLNLFLIILIVFHLDRITTIWQLHLWRISHFWKLGSYRCPLCSRQLVSFCSFAHATTLTAVLPNKDISTQLQTQKMTDN